MRGWESHAGTYDSVWMYVAFASVPSSPLPKQFAELLMSLSGTLVVQGDQSPQMLCGFKV